MGAGEKNLSERIDGMDAVHAAVDIFYNKVLSDKAISFFFPNANMPSLKNNHDQLHIQR